MAYDWRTLLEMQQEEEGEPTDVPIPGSDLLHQSSWEGPPLIPDGAVVMDSEDIAHEFTGVVTTPLTADSDGNVTIGEGAVGQEGAPVPAELEAPDAYPWFEEPLGVVGKLPHFRNRGKFSGSVSNVPAPPVVGP